MSLLIFTGALCSIVHRWDAALFLRFNFHLPLLALVFIKRLRSTFLFTFLLFISDSETLFPPHTHINTLSPGSHDWSLERCLSLPDIVLYYYSAQRSVRMTRYCGPDETVLYPLRLNLRSSAEAIGMLVCRRAICFYGDKLWEQREVSKSRREQKRHHMNAENTACLHRNEQHTNGTIWKKMGTDIISVNFNCTVYIYYADEG